MRLAGSVSVELAGRPSRWRFCCLWGLEAAARRTVISETLSAIVCRRRGLGRAVSNQYKHCSFLRIFSCNTKAQQLQILFSFSGKYSDCVLLSRIFFKDFVIGSFTLQSKPVHLLREKLTAKANRLWESSFFPDVMRSNLLKVFFWQTVSKTEYLIFVKFVSYPDSLFIKYLMMQHISFCPLSLGMVQVEPGPRRKRQEPISLNINKSMTLCTLWTHT